MQTQGISDLAAYLNWLPVQERGVCSDSNQTAQPHQIPMLKNLEMISGINYNKLQTKFAAKFAEKKGCKWKAMSESHADSL